MTPGGRYGCPLARTGFALLARKSNTRIPRLAVGSVARTGFALLARKSNTRIPRLAVGSVG